jgi:glyoxylate/hydroxypyruvate reductase
MVTVVICSYFEEEYIQRIRKVDGRLQVLYREDLVPPPRWTGDHLGLPDWSRSEEGEEEFLAMLEEAEVLYDFLFSDNLRHYLNGEPLINELDKKLLY